MKDFLLLAIMTIGMTQANAQTFVCDNITYEPSGETATVTAADTTTTYSGDIVIPNYVTHEGVTYTVTAIASRAFYTCGRLRSIYIPEGVTSIGEWAFAGCANMTSITLPEGLSTITKSMLYGCWNLTRITLPSTLRTIEENAFYNCTRLKNIEFNEGLTLIGENAFSYCTSLAELSLPSSLRILRSHCFNQCTSLSSITIPSSTYQIGENPFFECESLTNIDVADDNTHFCSVDGVLLNADSTNLYCCPIGKKGRYKMPSTVTTIDEEAFFNCSGLTAIELSPILTMIGERALYGCSGLRNIIFPSTTINIGVRALRECTSLVSLSSYAITPPTIYNTTFGESTNNLPLYVPRRAVASYQNAAFWRRFYDIRPIHEYFNHSDVSIYRGARGQFTVSINSSEPISAFAFNMELPDGFALSTQEDAVKIAERLSESNINVDIKTLNSKSFRVEGTVGNPEHTNINGQLMTLSMIADEVLDDDEYCYSIKDAEITYTDGEKVSVSGCDSFIIIEEGEMGDVNNNGTVSVSDVTQTINYIMGVENNGYFVFPLADMDQNGRITVNDITLIVNKIIGL